MSVVGSLWKWASAVFGEVLDQAGPKSPTTPAPALKKIYTGQVKHEHGFDALREKGMDVSRWVLQTGHGLEERKKERESGGWARTIRI